MRAALTSGPTFQASVSAIGEKRPREEEEEGLDSMGQLEKRQVPIAI